jgi:hypothetical protein
MTAFYPVLVLHSIVRWLLLTGILVSIWRGYRGYRSGRAFTVADTRLRLGTLIAAHTQAVLGLTLYFISPLISYFLHNFGTAVHDRQIRFFGMEHSLMMLVGITLLTIGAAKAKRRPTDKEKHKTIAIWYTIALLVILSSIPWAFSPLVSRPWVRWF